MTRPTRWSYSSLSMYEECPAKWKYSYIEGRCSAPSAAMQRGTRLHSLCEMVLEGFLPQTPPELSLIGPVLESLKAEDALAEKAWRLDATWSPVASGSWLLGIVDVHFVRDDVLHVYDFKSGRSYPGHKKQLELYALIGLAIYPQTASASVGAIYIDTGKIGHKRSIPRAESKPLVEDWTARASRMFADDGLEPTPGSGCYWCAHKSSEGGPCEAWKT